jgi:hypothetical protein
MHSQQNIKIQKQCSTLNTSHIQGNVQQNDSIINQSLSEATREITILYVFIAWGNFLTS